MCVPHITHAYTHTKQHPNTEGSRVTSSKLITLDSLSEKLKDSRWASVWEGWNEISSLCPEVTPQLQGMVLTNLQSLGVLTMWAVWRSQVCLLPLEYCDSSARGAWSPVPTLEATLQGAGAVWHLAWQVPLEASYSLHTAAVSFLQTFPVLFTSGIVNA